MRARREFFLISPERVVAALRLAALEDVTPREDDASLSEEVRHDLEEARARRSAFNFTMVNVPVGATLTFTRDPGITATVADTKRVQFNRKSYEFIGGGAPSVCAEGSETSQDFRGRVGLSPRPIMGRISVPYLFHTSSRLEPQAAYPHIPIIDKPTQRDVLVALIKTLTNKTGKNG